VAASAASAATVPAAATPAAASGVLTVDQLRAKYKYVDQSPNPAQATCATCYAFRPSTGGPTVAASCLLVPGPIVPGGWCSVWGLNPTLKTK
jgi:hypothetical protein